MTRFLTICTALLASGSAALAQFPNVLDNATNQTVDTVWITDAPIIVGSTTSSNSLDINYGGFVRSAGGVIGDMAAASNNTVTISSTNAAWVVDGDLWVGNGGSQNSMMITNGGRVLSANGYVGNSNTAMGNVVSVAASQSFWNITNTLTVGSSGNSNNQVNVENTGIIVASNLVIHADNELNINAGGVLAITDDFNRLAQSNLNWNSGGQLSVGGNLTGLDNHLDGTNLFLTINGGTWTNLSANRTIGEDGFDNRLTIQNGGRVDNADGIIGASTTAASNTVVVTGTNSVWNNEGDLSVGENGAANNLYVQNGGTVSNVNAFVGRSAGSSNNYVGVSGDGSLWVNNGKLTVGGTNNTGNEVEVFSGGTIKADELIINSSNSFTLGDSGTLALGKGFDASTNGFNWTAGTLSVGGRLSGLDTNSTGTILTDDKSVVLNGGSFVAATDLVVGFEDSDISFAITNGGGAENASAYIGWGADAASNSVLVSDGGAWTNNGNLYVGVYPVSTNLLDAGAGNSLTVSNGGWVHVGGVDTSLSSGSGGIAVASNAMLAVSESSSVVTEGLFIDDDGDFDLDGTLRVTGDFDADQTGFNWNDGAALTVNSALTYTNDIGGSNKTLNVAGGSWSSGGNVAVNGVGNSVFVKDGGLISNLVGAIGETTNDVNNSVTVSGSGTRWINGGNLMIGEAGSDSSLTISDGGLVANESGIIGGSVGGLNNRVLVSGAGSVWSNQYDLVVGFEGSGNTLEIVDQGHVFSGGDNGFGYSVGYIGFDSSSTENRVLVSGSNSVWRSLGEIYVGFEGSSNSLEITNGGRVEGGFGIIGDSVDASGNMVIVSGADSTWTNTGSLTVGSAGSENSLVLKNDAMVVNGGGRIGVVSNSSLNSVLVESGAVWKNLDELHVGYGGTSNTMEITSGGRVESAEGWIGTTAMASENRVTVSGKDSAWINSGDLIIGGGGASNALYVLAGGVVSNNNAYVGQSSAVATNNLVSVSGEDSIWASSGALQIGSTISISNAVTVSENGTVSAQSLEIFDGNTFNLLDKGTLAMTGNFDFSADTNNLNWASGGTLAIKADLQGTTEHNGNGLILAIDEGGTWENAGSDHTIGSTGEGAVLKIRNGGSVVNDNGYVGAVASASGNQVMVEGAGSIWENLDTLYVGAVSNKDNKVSVADGGTVKAANLNIAENNRFVLDDRGTLQMTGATFDYSAQTNLEWLAGGNLAVEGRLDGLDETELVVDGITNAATYLDGAHVVTITGADGRLSGNTNLIIGLDSDDTQLKILDGGKVDNANGFIGWDIKTDSDRNSVLVSGPGSTWTNRENLYIGGYPTSNGWVQAGSSGQNSLMVESNGWVLVGDVTAADLATANGGVAVASSNDTELVLGYGILRTESLYVGAGSNLTGTVEVRKEGAVYLDKLIIAAGSNEFKLAGSLIATNGFDAGMNGFKWEDEGRITLQSGELTGISGIEGTNRAVFLNSANWMTNTSLVIGAYGQNNKLTVSGDSQLGSSGATIGASNAVDSAVSLSGSNVVWNNTADLTVGVDGSGNSLTLTDGARFYNGSAFIGDSASSSNNFVVVSGSNTLWNNSGDLYVGKLGSNSTLTISGDSTVTVGNDLFVQNFGYLELTDSNSTVHVTNDMTVADSVVAGNGTVRFSDGDNTLTITGTNSALSLATRFEGNGGVDGIVVSNSQFVVSGTLTNRFSDFSSLTMTDSVLLGGGTLDGIADISMQGGTLELTDHFTIDGEFSATGQPKLKMTANEHSLNLKNALPFNLSALDAEVTVASEQNVKNFTPTLVTAENGLTGEFGDITFNERYLLYGFAPVYSGNQITIKPVAAADGEISSTVAMVGGEGVRAGFNGMKNAVFTRTKQLRRNVVATAHSIPQEAFLLSNTNAPSGAMGPGDQNTIFDMRIWIQQFNGQGESDAYGLSHGFKLNSSGTTIGGDRLFGDALTAGFNYTYARSDARSTNSDSVDTETYWLGGYAEWVSADGLYVDALLSYGHSDYTSRRVAENYRGYAKYSGNNYGGYADVGQYYHYKNLALSPYIGLHALTANTEDFVETEQDGNQLYVDERRRSWIESAVGLKARYRFDTRRGRFQTTGYAEWLHDFLQQDVYSELSVDGLGPIETARISPDADVFGAGLGLSWIYTDYLEFGVGYNGRFSDHYEEHTGSLMIDIRF